MLALAGLLTVVVLSLVITRVATVALVLTGLSRESARFQARSALSGVGFTTTEAESVVNHPVRRRVVMTLMLLGGAGTVTVLGALVLSFANADASQRTTRVVVMLVGLCGIWLLARSAWVERRLSKLIARGLERWTDLAARDYAALLHLSHDYTVSEMAVTPDHEVAGRTLGELRLRDEGIIVLGITRADGTYLGAPRSTPISARRTRSWCTGAPSRSPASTVGDASGHPHKRPLTPAQSPRTASDGKNSRVRDAYGP